MSCEDYPTAQTAKTFKLDAETVNEVVTLEQDRTSEASDGKTKKTLWGIETDATNQRNEFEQLASDQLNNFEVSFSSQFNFKRIGNISDYAGQSLPDADKLNSYQFPDDSGDWYAPEQGQPFPITIPADPTAAGSNWYLQSPSGVYRGLWPNTDGSANKGETYQTQVSGTPTGQYFTALQNTTVDPAGDDVNWRAVVSFSSVSGENLISNASFEIAGSVANPPDATPRSYSADDELFSGFKAVGATSGVTYVDGKLNGTGQLYVDVYKTEKQKLSTVAHVASIADSSGLPDESGASFVDNGDYWRVTFDMSDTFSVKLEEGNVATRHKLNGIESTKLNHLEHYGVSKNNTPEQNAAYFVNSAKDQGAVITHESYEFDFSSIPLFDVDSEFFLFDMGMKEQVFKNFNGIRCTEAKALKVNCNLDINNTNLIKFLKMEKVEVMYSDFMYVKNVKMDTDLDCWFLDVNSNNDVEMTSGFGVCKFNNWIAKVTDGVSPFGSAMTIFGNANAASGFSETHTWNFESLSVNEFYTIQSSDDSIVDGESDALRFFSNKAIVNIGSCNTKNFAKRFVKSQNVCHLTIDSFGTYLDSRFQGSSNHVSTIDMQFVSQAEPSTCVINNIDLDYSLASGAPLLFSCGGNLEHSLVVNGGDYKNYTIFSSTSPVNASLNNMTGEGTAINCTLSDSVKLNNYKDSDLISTRCNLIKFEKSNISTKRTPTSNSLVTNAVFVDTVIDDWDSGDRLGTVRRISGLELNITKGTSNGRPLFPVSGKYYYENIEVNNTSGVNIELIYTTTGSGDIIVRTARLGSNVNLAFLSGGTWDVTLDDCDNEVITGSGVSSKVKASYVAL